MENSILVDFLPGIGKLNALYANILANKQLYYEEQKFITAYYAQYKDVILFDKMIVRIIMSGQKEQYVSIIKNLHDEISGNIQLFSSNEKFFTEIDTDKICDENISISQEQIQLQIKNIQEYHSRITELNNQYENASWHNDKIRLENLTHIISKVDNLYKYEKSRLDNMYHKRQEQSQEVFQYRKNHFTDIHQLNRDYLTIINKRFAEQESLFNQPGNKSLSSKSYYFKMGLIAEICTVCVNRYIEHISENELNNFFNLISTEKTPVIRGRNKEKIYYLLFKLEETIKETDKKHHWISAMLTLFNFDREKYLKKRKESLNYQTRSPQEEAFAELINPVFEKYADQA